MRRRLLLGLGLGLAGGAVVWRLRPRPTARASAIAEVLATNLGYLQVSDEDREAFARDFAAGATMAERRLVDRNRWSGARIEALEARICTTFLMSSDFFKNGADESRPVRYLALYEPTRVGCANPFARFDLD
jgi:hypothetical protein